MNYHVFNLDSFKSFMKIKVKTFGSQSWLNKWLQLVLQLQSNKCFDRLVTQSWRYKCSNITHGLGQNMVKIDFQTLAKQMVKLNSWYQQKKGQTLVHSLCLTKG